MLVVLCINCDQGYVWQMYHEINSYKKVASQIIESSSYEPVHLLPRSKNVSVPKFRRSTVRPKFSTELDRSVKNVVGGFGQTTEARPNFLSPDLFFGFLLRKKIHRKIFSTRKIFIRSRKNVRFRSSSSPVVRFSVPILR